MTDVLIKNADVMLTMDDTRRELHGADILIHDGVIAQIGQNIRADDCTVFNAEGKIVTPGLVSGDLHFIDESRLAVDGGATVHTLTLG